MTELQFWRTIDKNGPVPHVKGCPSTPCWLWTAGCDSDGYAHVRMGGKVCQAHRVAYRKKRGPIPKGKEIHHKCENRRCVRPSHLKACTHAEHTSGKMHGHHTHPDSWPRGEKHWNVKLTRRDIRAIRKLYSKGLTQKVIAGQFGVGQTWISVIARGKNWKHVK